MIRKINTWDMYIWTEIFKRVGCGKNDHFQKGKRGLI